MTLNEAIEHCEATAAEKEAQAKFYKTYLKDEADNLIAITECQDCAKEHRQLAEWLRELRYYREKNTEEYVYSYAPGTAACPTCGRIFSEEDVTWKGKYCFHCGQKLQWLTVEKMGDKPVEQEGEG